MTSARPANDELLARAGYANSWLQRRGRQRADHDRFAFGRMRKAERKMGEGWVAAPRMGCAGLGKWTAGFTTRNAELLQSDRDHRRPALAEPHLLHGCRRGGRGLFFRRAGFAAARCCLP